VVALLGDEEHYFLPSGSEVKQSDTGASCTAMMRRLSLPCHWTQLQPGTLGSALSQLAWAQEKAVEANRFRWRSCLS
jgi:hypothetical protein